MLVERIWPANAFRNFHYLIACPDTGDALAIDPLDWRLCLERAREKGWTIRYIVNTHEHEDHVGGNARLVSATGAKLFAHHLAAARIGGVDTGLHGGDILKIGRAVELECLDTPGHTMAHVCLLSHTDIPALFSGDTLFNAGVGNCRNGGDVRTLFDTCNTHLASLPDETLLYPGHEYLCKNLGFTLAREPHNERAKRLLDRSSGIAAHDAPVITLAEERAVNTFFRLQSPEIIAGLREIFPDLDGQPDALELFSRLRQLRDEW